MAKPKKEVEAVETVEVEAVETEKTAKVKLVKMAKEGVTADVHPLEVENYRAGGFSEA